MKTIFVVEPDAVLSKAYASAIEANGLIVYKFRTASLAVKALEKMVPDLIVLELAMPVHNGFELLYELLSYSDTRKIKVVVNSFVQSVNIPWGFINRGDMNIVEYLYKPLSQIDDVTRAVREYA